MPVDGSGEREAWDGRGNFSSLSAAQLFNGRIAFDNLFLALFLFLGLLVHVNKPVISFYTKFLGYTFHSFITAVITTEALFILFIFFLFILLITL